MIDLADAGVASVATAQEAGELFAYHIDTPVSIPRQHSAMLPIVNQEIDATKVSIFNPATHPKYPLNGLELKNTTGLNLMQGPVTSSTPTSTPATPSCPTSSPTRSGWSRTPSTCRPRS